ncbi:MAG: hypothetical protein ACRDEB_00540 [Chitinophagaceae bacterium]
MKKIFFLITCIAAAAASYTQELFQVSFARGETLSSLSYKTDQDIIIRISDDGKLLEWGTDPGTGRFYNDPRKLQPYLGRVEYYGQEYDSAFRGKVKSIGTCSFTYYGKFETDARIGKLKTFGRLLIDYYDNYEDAAFKGKLKLAGTVLFSYYSSFENESYRGKISSVNNNTITYYSSFDDKAYRGKLKSIGAYAFTWYPSYDRYQGALKSGTVTQNINGITFIIM